MDEEYDVIVLGTGLTGESVRALPASVIVTGQLGMGAAG